MIVICEECGKKYQIDPEKIKGKKSRFRCRFCKSIITVTKPETPAPQPAPATPPDLQPETSGGVSAEAAGIPEIAPETDASPSATETQPDMDTTEAVAQARKRGLGLRAKMILMFFVIPLALFAAAGGYYLVQLNALETVMSTETTKAVTRMGQDSVRQIARLVARECGNVLRAHQDLQETDFMNHEELRTMSMQRVGITGYTALYSVGPMTLWTHPNKKLIGKPLTKAVKKPLGKDFHRWVNIVRDLDRGENVETSGYYLWTDPDGALREKFMVCSPIEGTKFGIAATIYMDEFVRPIEKIRRRAEKIAAGTRKTTMGFLVGTIVLVGLIVAFYGHRLTGKIKKLTDHAERISLGELDAKIDIRSKDEIGALSDAITRMQNSIRLSIQRLRRRR